MNEARPHDLLFLRGADAFVPAGERPGWLDAPAFAGAPVVVRRAAGAPGMLPVGARGVTRDQRCGGHVAVAAVVRRVTPEMLARVAAPGDLPCLAALRALAPRLDALGLAWGPAGGVGFYLASGVPVLRAGSDLDLLVRLPQRPDAALVTALAALETLAPCRVDIQVDTGHGGCALAELAAAHTDPARRGRVLVKTALGPVLTHDPWRLAAA